MPKLSPWEFQLAVKDNRVTFIQEQFELKNFDPNMKFHGQTLLNLSVTENRRESMECLLKLGANPNLKSDKGGRYESSLITAVRLKNLQFVEILLKNGADTNLTDFYGQDAIFHAVLENADDILIYLLNYQSTDLFESKAISNYHPVKLCPLYITITQSLMYPLKKRSFFRLVQFYFHHSCLRSLSSKVYCCQLLHAGQDYNYFLGSQNKHIVEDMIKVDREVINWIYLSTGNSNILQQLQPFSKSETKLDFYQSKTENTKAEPTFALDATIQTHIHSILTLKNLSRITIRKICHMAALKNKSTFSRVINDISLPKSLVDFVLLKNIQFVYKRK